MRAPSFQPSIGRARALVITLGVITLTTLTSGGATAAIAPGTLLWQKHFGINDGGEVSALVVGSAGTVYITGNTGMAMVTAAYSADGTKLWLTTNDEHGLSGGNTGYAITVAPDGQTVFVAGTSYSDSTQSDVLAAAYDATTGEERWSKFYDRGEQDADENTTSQSDYANSIAVSPDGATVYVAGDTGVVIGDTGYVDSTTIAFDAATGDLDWTSLYDGGFGTEGTRSMGIAPDGSAIFITGFSPSATYSSAFTRAIDPGTGDELWTRRYDGPAGFHDSTLSLAVRPDGSRVFVTGATGGTGSGTSDFDMVTIAYDAVTGDKVWARFFAGDEGGYDFGRSVTVSADGTRVYVVGHSLGAGAKYDVTTIAYKAGTGKRLWVQRAPGVASNTGLSADIAVSPDGSKIVVAAYRDRFLQRDAETISYSSGGVLRWTKLYDGYDIDRLTSAGVSPNGGRAYVAGNASGGAILAYKV